ncbi:MULTISPECIES: GNAT family N-acetyltransferase [unclassified Paracoccus (in: a-proteobacteria)]|jgi:ribosomal protein S18 acetylase RimI-like enzyme|uniref:GNAT family N-acetyltransferase n=1 Tax=unclassified Paracoccus (in: a-proteobacteria) TaxID=2688777 RepID=UPI0023318ADD|nr:MULTISPECIES: GNAT family N-acetyltransferase [unclassified Paracoccus (in: a-proteobacteria)]MDB2490328.1 GNAT family N-acetyltransferase [Paracoccus sp. (in: a-proteobacteria)]|tara:strand:- start:4784 stop:5299 length:516 start_codon:yes stop_codon:yes gene_type:complete
MTRNRTQDRPVTLESPISAAHLPAAAALWGRHFACPRAALTARSVCARHGIVALNATGRVVGVAGFRDAGGGFLRRAPWWGGLFYRDAPATAALVIDGIVALPRGEGVGRALIRAALAEAGRQARPGLRAEVRGRNADALRFYRRLGFVEEGRGRYGWAWSGQALLMRLPA